MPTSLAAGKTKFTILVAKPANEEAPTATELNAGIDMSCKVLASTFNFTFTDSERITGQRALCDEVDTAELGVSNAELTFEMWRYWLEAGGADPAEDNGFSAVKDKGTTFWAYKRKTDKKATEDWAATDEIQIGGKFETDNLQDPGDEGKIRYRVPTVVRDAWAFLTVATA